MRKKTFVAWAIGLTALLVAGGLWASNVGFKLNYPMQAAGAPVDVGTSASGRNTIALPFNQQTNLLTAFNLIGDIEAGVTTRVDLLSRFVRSNDSFVGYNAVDVGADFPLTAGTGYLVTMGQTFNYIIVGSHNPGLGISLRAAGSALPEGGNSASGRNLYAYPYHSTAATALDLINEINGFAGPGTVQLISRFVKNNDSFVGYNGVDVGANYPLKPGEAYTVTVSTDVTGYIPSHY